MFFIVLLNVSLLEIEKSRGTSSWCTWRKRACEEHLAGTRSVAAVPVVGEQLEETMERAHGKRKIELELFCLLALKIAPPRMVRSRRNHPLQAILKENRSLWNLPSLLEILLLSWILLIPITVLRKSMKKNPLSKWSKIFLLRKITDF